MPICKREGFENVRSHKKDETFHDNEDVFYCEVTNEIFREYDDYFRHVMVINSTVWQCEATAKENLTYAEALKSERKARKTMEQFKDCLRPPVMMVIEQAKQSSLNALHSIISKFLRRRFFLNETVTAYHKTYQYSSYKVIDIVPPGKSPPGNGVYEELEKLQYKLQRLDNPKLEVSVPFESIRRQRTELTAENLHMFIKNNVTRIEGILRPKPESYKTYVTDRKLTFSSIFIGKMPHFTPAKIKRPNEATLAKKQATLNKYLVKEAEAAKNALEAARREKEKVEKAEAKAKSLKEEMERVRREKQERLVELERERIEKRAKLLARIETECTMLLTKTDDLERTDQRLLPKYTPVQSYIPSKLLGDAFMVREFMHSFAGILSGIDVFRSNLSFYEMSRAFTLREVSGPLSDIVLILLGTIFDMHREESEECAIKYLLLRKEMRRREPLISQSQATRSHFFSHRHFAAQIGDLPLDALTLSEVLRLHLLSSGAVVYERAEKWRMAYRNGYVSSEDPGLALRMQHPHILRALKMYTFYQLPNVDIMRILRCLMAQILTYSNSLNLIEERMDEMAKANRDLRSLNCTENMRLANVQVEKRALITKHSQACMEDDVKNDIERKRQLEERLNKKIAELLAQSEREHRRHLQQVEKLQSSIFNYIVYLGMDRAYRKYYVLESMPGLFIEHPPDCMDTCLPEPPINTPDNPLSMHLGNLPRGRRDLRAFLLRHYTEEEKKAAASNAKLSNAPPTAAVATVGGAAAAVNRSMQENKENQANGPLNGLVNGLTTTTTTTAPKVEELQTNSETTAATAPPPPPPTQYELLMCTGDARHCIVHDEHCPDRQRWSYVCEEADIDALIESLNPWGDRESALREQLTTMRPLIFNHIKKCPVDMLSVDSKQFSKFKASMMLSTSRKYTNFGYAEGSDINEIMHTTLVDRILQFEQEIFTGDLGRVKVKDIPKWRQDVQQNAYDPQCKLQWGPPTLQKGGGGAPTVDAIEKEELYEQMMPDDDDDLDNMKGGDGGLYATLPFYDPGDGLGDTKEIDSEDSADEGISLHDSHTLRASVRNLASALLQVEQGIERRFLKEPFGAPQKELKNKELLERKLRSGAAHLKQWEVSLMECVSYSQVFLHLNVLHDGIMWARSTNKSSCQICRRGSDPDQMLLCDECNGGTHMFCMKPKMKTVPEGNWYCQRCVKNLGLKNESDVVRKKQNQQRTSTRRSNRRLRSTEIEEVLENEGVDDDEEENDDENNEDDEELADADDMSGNEDVDDEANEDTNVNDENDEDEEEEDDDNEQAMDEDIEDEVEGSANQSSNNNSEQEEDENVCVKCSYDGSEISCTRCKDNFHLECVNLKRTPRYGYVCVDCKGKEERKRKTRHHESDDEDDSDTETSEPANKRTRSTRVALRSNLTNGTSNTQQQQSEQTRPNGQRRSNRRTAENLPLNSSVLYKLLEDVMKHDKAWPFLRPVAQSQVPDYYDVIKTPMDFAKVKSKLNTGAYQLNEEVMNDIQLIFDNCDRYNIKGNEIYQAGAALEKFIVQRCNALILPFRPSDMNA